MKLSSISKDTLHTLNSLSVSGDEDNIKQGLLDFDAAVTTLKQAIMSLPPEVVDQAAKLATNTLLDIANNAKSNDPFSPKTKRKWQVQSKYVPTEDKLKPDQIASALKTSLVKIKDSLYALNLPPRGWQEALKSAIKAVVDAANERLRGTGTKHQVEKTPAAKAFVDALKRAEKRGTRVLSFDLSTAKDKQGVIALFTKLVKERYPKANPRVDTKNPAKVLMTW